MTGAIFVDTNVLVYARDASQPAKQAQARAWVERAWREQSGRTSMQVLSELYVTLTRKLRPGMDAAAAWDDVEALMAWEPQPIDRPLMLRAREIASRYGLAWWDAMIVAAAELQDCDVLLSEDLQDGMRFGSLSVRNPFRTAAAEEPAGYEPVAGLALLHRPRGRPRKRAAGRSG